MPDDILGNLEVDVDAAFSCIQHCYAQIEMLNQILKHRSDLRPWISDDQLARFAASVITNVVAEKDCFDDLIQNYPQHIVERLQGYCYGDPLVHR